MVDCILLNRVSDASQIEGFSLDAQSKNGRIYIQQCGYNLIKEFTYQESGSKEHDARKFAEIKKFINGYIAKKKSVLNIIVEKDDRLGRNHERKEFLQNLIEKGKVNLHFYVTKKVLTKDSPCEDFFMQDIYTSIDKHKSKNISREAKKGMREKASQGWLPHKPPIGYLNNKDVNSDEPIIINENERALIERIFSLRGNEGASYAVITDTVKAEGLVPDHRFLAFRKSTVEKILKNKFYNGWLIWNGQEYEGKHKPIISTALYLKVLKSFENPLTLSKRKHNGVFAGFLKCADCGCQITYNEKTKPNGKIHYLYVCANGKKAHPSLKGMYASEEMIMKQFSQPFDEINISYELADKISKALNESAEYNSSKFKKRMEDLVARVEWFKKLNVDGYEDYKKGTLTEEMFIDLKNKNELKKLEAQKAIEDLKLENSSQRLENAESTLELAKNAKTLWNTTDSHERVELLKKVLQNQKLRALTVEYEIKKPFKILGELKGYSNKEEWGG